MAIQISISNAIGSRYRGSVVPPIDPDAQAFITAASITDPTQQSAINQLVVDLKGYGVWSKMKALYPFVGGTAAQHKWNLKDPRDLDAAFRLVFSGGWTHSVNGALPNGTNAFADTKYNLSVNSTTSNVSGGVYSRTNVINGGSIFGALNASNAGLAVSLKIGDNNTYWAVNDSILTGPSNIVTDTRGLFILNKVSLTEKRIYRNGSQISTFTPSSNTAPSVNVYYGARNNNGTAGQYDTRELAFGFLGDTLTNTEVSNLYTAVQAFQTTLGRSIGTQTVSDADAQAFVTNAGIVDQVEANAVNNLVIGLKADGLWTKIYAAYPMVGGTSTSTSYNLKNTAQYQITWNGGWTWNNNGVTPNGTNGFGNTGFNPVTAGITKTNFGVSAYSRTNIVENGSLIGLISAAPSYIELRPRRASNIDVLACYDDTFGYGDYLTNSLGLFTASRSGTTQKYYQGATEKSQRTAFAATADLNGNIYIGARNFIGFPTDSYSTKQTAWAAFHEFFNATEMNNYNTAVQTFQTALARQV